ncbi:MULTISPECIES: M1 family metallopeptidase [unclassified Idiomarina]|uniref:M1 family metallopeptidase n=1 Tax=unclassified Idiomarina TaxID=2614829 RepID=UPI000C8C3A40|nr:MULTISPECIES: M1 family metallopeptidase [unclassified Idiomarina]MAD53445.1 aminopeptidase [Idiomarinaceae bacterium]NQZ05111.1 M1 family metallopeptidase [Idiomarina sp.]|tara:strand:- start:9 stop:2354 length:2346 start_codon:yes stop_codon:yes gene_type:complete
MKLTHLLGVAVASMTVSQAINAQAFDDKFRQLNDDKYRSPNIYRTASGAPGHGYWQQQADYDIQVTLNDENQSINARSTITYTNNSPDTLRYIWVQLDQNRFKKDSIGPQASASSAERMKKVSFSQMETMMTQEEFPAGYTITDVSDPRGEQMDYIINDTMMRIDLDKPLKSGESIEFNIGWKFNIIEADVLGGRGGYEYFEDDGNYLYEMAQWFPRVAAYYDAEGWQNKQFMGRGEFTLEFGNYEVAITVPADHIVAATGTLQNPDDVLTDEQQERLEEAETADKPVKIVTQEEALENEKEGTSETKTWVFKADNVRDFAWASSRKFIWDAQGFDNGESDVLAMSYYPEEGNPLWERYSTASIIHTIEHYNKYSFAYPYPVAISVNGPVGGMEYPMLTFNGPRPYVDEDSGEKYYSKRTKYGLISVIIHEIGHSYFPMIVNSDERQWTWMDEGLNTYLQFLAEQAWEDDYPSWRGEARNITGYMASQNQMPIMTNSESILQFGNNAYGKPATALNILRETIVGRELFDFAFREYSRRWKFKRPTPEDFFRTLEDASGVDLDWFIRGWFYTTDHVDISLDKVNLLTVNTQDPEVEKAWKKQVDQQDPKSITAIRNEDMVKKIAQQEHLRDFYNENDEYTVTNADRNEYKQLLDGLDDEQKQMLKNGKNFYVLDFSNKGGLVMPILLDLHFADGTKEHVRIPAEIWRRSPEHVSKLLIRDKKIDQIVVDPYWETADTDTSNNYWPARAVPSRIELYKRDHGDDSMMERYNEELDTDDKNAEE